TRFKFTVPIQSSAPRPCLFFRALGGASQSPRPSLDRYRHVLDRTKASVTRIRRRPRHRSSGASAGTTLPAYARQSRTRVGDAPEPTRLNLPTGLPSSCGGRQGDKRNEALARSALLAPVRSQRLRPTTACRSARGTQRIELPIGSRRAMLDGPEGDRAGGPSSSS